MRTEDQVRDEAKIILGLNDVEPNIQQGTGQITTFNQLGFKGKSDKPDGWYLPSDEKDVAIILETKSEKEDLANKKWVDELRKNLNIIKTKYHRTIGVLYNGIDLRVFRFYKKTGEKSYIFDEIDNTANTLQHKSYYISLYNDDKIDKQKIYLLTKKINECLHKQFGIKNLYHRMIFTACALVAKRYGAMLLPNMNFSIIKNSILSTLAKSIENDRKQNLKLDILIEVYSEIRMNNETNQDALNNFIEWVTEISENVNSDKWNGEDVMGIFFNEFNRYKKKSESGQIFTPDHITSFMYRLIDVDKDDRVLDATCGSGAFLVKSMCNMMKEAGGSGTKEAESIRKSQLFGIEFDREIFALACANMLIHKDGKTNLEQLDARTNEASTWIKSKNITKVLMNPPYENTYGCLEIVKNVLSSVPKGTKCAFILPDKKLEKNYVDKKIGNKLLKDNTLTTIIKMPENLFFGVNTSTSIFIFESGKAQKGKNIIGYYISNDGLETVKNQGRQDIKNKWKELEDYWIKAIHDGNEPRFSSKVVIDPSEHLSYPMPEAPFEVYEEDFIKTVLDYEMFQAGVDTKELEDKILKRVLYSSKISKRNNIYSIKIQDSEDEN
ncbi:MAG: SAM-dependent DNA methyltransferase [Prevotella sp.]|nr:SAM-dependent DNA methyltransferase [Prevotella sp.]